MGEPQVVQRVALLVNQYPRVSHSFIRREIRMLERMGIEVNRISVRRAREPLVDPQDRDEATKTAYLLEAGIRVLLGSTLAAALRRPRRFAEAFGLTLRSAWRTPGRGLHHLAYLVEAAHLARHLERRGLSHVHAHFVTNSTTVAMLSAALGAHGFSFTVHRVGGPEDPGRVWLREKVRRAAFVVAVSEAGQAEVQRQAAPGDAEKVVCIRCGLEEEVLANRPSPQAARRLVFVGRCEAEKGLLDLVEAVARLSGAGASLELVVVGDGPLRKPAEERAHQLGVAAIVRFTGWLDDRGVREELTRARALVLPSRHEGLPVVVMEAFAAGRPVVATAVGSVGELVESGRTGWLVVPGDVAALAGALREALDADATTLAALGAEARRRVVERHAAARNVRRLAELLRSAPGVAPVGHAGAVRSRCGSRPGPV